MICIYCEKNNAIENSHIIPKFFYDWMKQTAITPYFREISTPNRRLQDGLKVPLLCENCENNFSKFENNYKSHLFKKIVNYRKEIPEVLLISESDKIFYLSLVWRQLVNYLIYEDKTEYYPDEVSFIATKANIFKKWINNISNFEKEGGTYPIYIIPTKPDILKRLNFKPSATGTWYEYDRSIGSEFVVWGKEKIDKIIVYIKLPFQIIVCDLTNNSRDWNIPALHKIDEFELCDIKKVPEEIIDLFFDRFYVKAMQSYESLSKIQHGKILKDLDKLNDEEIKGTGSYKSMTRHNKGD
ncbi:hypothetical protein [Acinetobacter pittii]|uniref:hypothetical protein n=1 Tax=Acinetobacter pittii TaxID=48296 RepID=UPI00301D0EC3